jgi:hypothetical protein
MTNMANGQTEGLDLLIVMNNPLIAGSYKLDAEMQFGLTALDFTNGKSALEYLNSCSDEQLPRATLVDCALNPNNDTDFKTAIFDYLNERNATENFGYLCMVMGPNERELHQKTGVKLIEQTAEFGEGDPVYDLMAGLAKKKD